MIKHHHSLLLLVACLGTQAQINELSKHGQTATTTLADAQQSHVIKRSDDQETSSAIISVRYRDRTGKLKTIRAKTNKLNLKRKKPRKSAKLRKNKGRLTTPVATDVTYDYEYEEDVLYDEYEEDVLYDEYEEDVVYDEYEYDYDTAIIPAIAPVAPVDSAIIPEFGPDDHDPHDSVPGYYGEFSYGHNNKQNVGYGHNAKPNYEHRAKPNYGHHSKPNYRQHVNIDNCDDNRPKFGCPKETYHARPQYPPPQHYYHGEPYYPPPTSHGYPHQEEGYPTPYAPQPKPYYIKDPYQHYYPDPYQNNQHHYPQAPLYHKIPPPRHEPVVVQQEGDSVHHRLGPQYRNRGPVHHIPPTSVRRPIKPAVVDGRVYGQDLVGTVYQATGSFGPSGFYANYYDEK